MGSLIDAYNKGKKSSTSTSAATQTSKGSSLLDAYNRGKNMGAAASAPKTTTTTKRETMAL